MGDEWLFHCRKRFICQCNPHFQKVFKPRIVEEGSFLTYQMPFALPSQPLQHPSAPSHFLAMAHFNGNDNFYSASTTPDELNPYPFLQLQASATGEEAYTQEAPPFAGGWTTVDQSGYSAIASTSLPAAPDYGAHLSKHPIYPRLTRVSLESASTFESSPTPFHESYWSNASQPTEPEYPSTWSRHDFFAGGQGWETTMQALNFNLSRYNFWLWKIEAQILTVCK